MSKTEDQNSSDDNTETENSCENSSKKSREDLNGDGASLTLKITTESSDYFFLPRFNSKDVFQQERFPKNFTEFDFLIDKIFNSLEETENVFINQADEVADRDVELVNQRTKLENLRDCLSEKQQIHENIDQSVEFIVNLSNDLQNILTKMEKKFDNSPHLDNGLKFSPDRMQMFHLMLKMNLKQKDMLQQISDSIGMMNDAIGNNQVDPIGQITKILNLHVETLAIMERKMKELEGELRSVKSLREYYITLQHQILSSNQ